MFLLFKAHFDHVAFLVTVESKMTAINNRMFGRHDEIGSFHLNQFIHCRFKFESFGNVCIVCPVVFELLRNYTTRRFTIMKKLNVFDQIVSASRGPGRREICHLTDFFQTFTVCEGQ